MIIHGGFVQFSPDVFTFVGTIKYMPPIAIMCMLSIPIGVVKLILNTLTGSVVIQILLLYKHCRVVIML